MIGKCLALLCVAFGIAAGSCLEVPQVQYQLRSAPVVSSQIVSSPVVSSQIVTPVVSTPVVSTPVVQLSSGNNLFRSEFIGSNIVSSGSVVATDGPETAPLPVVQAPSVTLPTVETPIVTLSSQPIPAPRVISQRCICTKTIVKPQVIQRQVTVPKVQRYFKRTVTPIVENVSYKSRPITRSGCGSSVAVAPAVTTTSVNYSGNNGNCYSRLC